MYITYDQKRAMTLLNEDIKKQIVTTTEQVVQMEEQVAMLDRQYAIVDDDSTYEMLEKALHKQRDLTDKLDSLKLMQEYMNKFNEELEFIEWLNV